MKLHELLRKMHVFIKSPKKWCLPSKSDVLIYDTRGSDILKHYFEGNSVYVHSTRWEEINISCFLRALFNRSFWQEKPLTAYTDEVIKFVAPKVAITYTDFNPDFFKLHSTHSKLVTVFFQQGYRGGNADILNRIKKDPLWFVNFIFVMNAHIGKKYSEYIQGHMMAVGSLINNHLCNVSEDVVSTDYVWFISQYHHNEMNSDSVFYMDGMGRKIYWKKFFEVDVSVVRWLGQWCVDQGKKLGIIGRYTADNINEFLWYESLLNGVGCRFVYEPNALDYGAYLIVKKAAIVVAIDSTLGYEALGAGKKTAFFTGRGRCVDDNKLIFGWPARLPVNGPFWTNQPDEKEFGRIMDYLNTVSDDEWEDTRRKYAYHVMAYDHGNSRFKLLIKQLFSQCDISKK